MSTFTCPLCGYTTRFGNAARIALHARVSHGNAEPIEGVTS